MRWRRALTLGMALSIVASGALAHGVDLRLGDCVANNGLASATLGCAATTPPIDLVGTVELSNALPQFCAAGVLIDFQSAAPAVPNWWRLDGTGCRSGSATAYYNATSGGACTSLWSPGLQGGYQVLPIEQWQVGVGGANRIRYNGLAAINGYVDLQQQDPVNGVNEWGVVRLHITFDRSTGGAACSGCNTVMCVVLTQVDINYGNDGEKKATVTTAGAGGNSVMLNPSVPGQGCSDGHTTRNATWGSLKSLYR